MKQSLLLAILTFSTWRVFAQTDTVVAHFIYGSKPIGSDESSWFGGKLGGHVGLEVSSDSVYHFNPGGKVRAFGRKDEKGTWALSKRKQFFCTFGCDSNKIVSIKIPITREQKIAILKDAESFLNSPSYPYSFFGMRCTAACYHLLSIGGITKRKSKTAMILKNFYPRKLRKRLLKRATSEHWVVERQAGRTSRKWDHD